MASGATPTSGDGHHEPWAIRLAGDEAVRKPGERLREWAGDDRSRTRRMLDRLTLREEQDPKLAGAWGEELVARELDRFDERWTVVHGVRLSAKADVDHLVVGPPGVVCINAKWIKHEAKVEVSARRFVVSGYSRDYYPKAVAEARRVKDRLLQVTGLDVAVHSVIAVTGLHRKNLRVRQQPVDVTVVARRELYEWLLARPELLEAETCRQLGHAVRRPSTWDPSQVSTVLDRPLDTTAQVEEPDPDGTLAVKVVEWRRYGHHRCYVNDASDGKALGWRDERTGKVHVENGVDPEVVHRALAALSAGTGGPT